MVSQELLVELKKILNEEFALDLSLDEVAEIASNLVSYFDLLIKINFTNKGGESL